MCTTFVYGNKGTSNTVFGITIKHQCHHREADA